jgi:hypothetical protein
MLLLVTFTGDAHVAFEVRMTEMVEGLGSDAGVYVAPVAPAMFTPFLCH